MCLHHSTGARQLHLISPATKRTNFALKQAWRSTGAPAPRRCLQGGHDAATPPPPGQKTRVFTRSIHEGGRVETIVSPPREKRRPRASPTPASTNGLSFRSAEHPPTHRRGSPTPPMPAAEPPDLSLGDERHLTEPRQDLHPPTFLPPSRPKNTINTAATGLAGEPPEGPPSRAAAPASKLHAQLN